MKKNPRSPFDLSLEPAPRYRGMRVSSTYVPVRDGTRLAVDVWLPGDLLRGEKVPAILFQTRYWRRMELKAPFNWFLYEVEQLDPTFRQMKPLFTGRGYALVYADIRGTGASYGVCRFPWEPVTIQDAWDLVDWIVAQDWCSGAVGGLGVSYLGTTAEMLLATGHPAVKAVVPMFNHPDAYTDISYPGGLLNARFIQSWSEVDADLDRNHLPPAFGILFMLCARGVQPVGGEAGRAALEEVVRIHAANGNAYTYAQGLSFRDELHPLGYCTDDLCVMRHWEIIRNSQVPVYGWASWQDAGTAQAVLRRFLTFPGPQRAAIGAWCHGGALQASPYRSAWAAPAPGPLGQWRETLRFFDAYLKNQPGSGTDENVLHYYTLGAETWQKTTSWPPPGVRPVGWYFGPQRTLTPGLPEEEGQDRTAVDFRATTGKQNRWWEQGVLEGKTVVYPDLAAQPAELLSYTSSPLEQEIEICGSPVVTLWVDSSEPDCAFYVYLEELAPGGKAFYLTEGQLRSIHRRVSQEPSPYQLEIPYHTFRQADALPLVPGKVETVQFGLLPISALVRRGRRLRVTIAGHDNGTFVRIPARGTPVWKIYRSKEYPSRIELPIK